MRITKAALESIVDSILEDTPQIDYHTPFTAQAQKDAIALAPPAVQRMWEDSKLRPWIRTRTHSYRLLSVTVPSIDYLSHEFSAAAVALGDKHVDQSRERTALGKQLMQAMLPYKTLKSLREAFPEFEKYMPKDGAPVDRSAPVIANVMADLVKAGWPKDKK